MTENVYRKLAQRLDAMPNSFPATESGSDLRLLAKMFTPKEAALAAVMRMTPEPAADIAARVGMDPKAAYRMLKGMARKGLIFARRGEGKFAFELMPFAVGFYEEQLPRMDEEMATLFEEYYREAVGAGITSSAPSLMRVIPVEEAIPFDLEIFPYERASELIENAKAWGVRDCICRVQQRLIGKGCDHPVEICLTFAPIAGVFDHSEVTRAITKEESLRLLRKAEESGLVHSTGNYRDGLFYICNCCTCCCAVLRGVAEFAVPTAVAHSDFHAVVDADLCIGCGDCVERCSFKALSVPNDVCEVDYARCVGCGLCAAACSTDALHLERRPEGEAPTPPADLDAWMVERAEERGISLEAIQ
jgi:electron transport complex protein RnfB